MLTAFNCTLKLTVISNKHLYYITLIILFIMIDITFILLYKHNPFLYTVCDQLSHENNAAIMKENVNRQTTESIDEAKHPAG